MCEGGRIQMVLTSAAYFVDICIMLNNVKTMFNNGCSTNIRYQIIEVLNMAVCYRQCLIVMLLMKLVHNGSLNVWDGHRKSSDHITKALIQLWNKFIKKGPIKQI